MSGGRANFASLQRTADGMISKWGGDAILRRSTGDRWCKAAVMTYSPLERAGTLRNPVDRKAIVSAVDLDVPPDQELDRLVTLKQPVDRSNPVVDEVLRIIEPPGKVGTSTETVFYRLSVRR